MLRKPLANSITSYQVLWFRLPGKKSKMLSQITGLSGVYYQLNYTNDILDGHYKLITSKETLFLKVTNINDSKAHIIAEKISHFLYENNINTLQCIEGFPKINFEHGVFLLAYPFVETHYVKPTTTQMGLIGTELGKKCIKFL